MEESPLLTRSGHGAVDPCSKSSGATPFSLHRDLTPAQKTHAKGD